MSSDLRLPAIDPADIEPKIGTNYPAPLQGPHDAREKRAVGDALGLTNFGVNITTIRPGVETALRHWHTGCDEFVYVLKGELVLITNDDEQVLTPGMAAGFKAGAENGHKLVNRSDADAKYLEVGDRGSHDEVFYPGADLWGQIIDGKRVFTKTDGTAY